MKRSFIYLFILMLICTAGNVFAQGEIYGKVTGPAKEDLGGVIVKVFQGGLYKQGSITEDDGSYSVKPLQPGDYSIEFSSSGYDTKRVSGITITERGTAKQNMQMQVAGIEVRTVDVIARRPIGRIEVTKTAKEIEHSAAGTDILSQVALTKNVYQSRSGGAIQIGGDRGNGTVYYVDGVVATAGAVNLPQGTVSQFQVFSSGIPANLGDATGGVVSITSKGPSSTIKVNSRFQHSIDGYNQNLANVSMTGPLISKTDKNGNKQPILGFLAGLEYQYNKDDDPNYHKNPILKQDVLKRLQDNPLTLVNSTNGSQMVSSSNFVTKDDFIYQKQNINNSLGVIRATGKLDYVVNPNINITAGGSFTRSDNQGFSRAASYFAPESIPNQITTVGRGYLRFKQSFNSSGKRQEGDTSHPVISNAYYTVQLDYQISNSNQQSSVFKHNLFDYGYVGKFTQSRIPTYQFTTDPTSGRQAVVLQTLDFVNGITFQASDKNPTLANYTKNVYENQGALGTLSDLTRIQAYGGLMNGDFPKYALDVQNVSRLKNIGAGLTGYSYSTFNQVGLHADAAFDFKPGKGKNAITHAIQFGLYYEQRSSSSFGASVNTGDAGVNSIWNLMNQLANRHILAFDFTNPIFIHNGVQYTKAQVDAGNFFLPTDTIIYNRADNGTQSQFDKSLRTALGAGKFDYLDVHSVDPSKLSLGMFSATELLGQSPGAGFVSYNGYDYTGKKMNGQVNFTDFFTAKDANGNYTRPIGAFSPNYIAGYVMDQFRFKDMQFNVGVRIERYDNNTKVLKDPYSLYALNTKSAVNGAQNIQNNGKHPDNIGNDYAVYVNNNSSTTPTIIGYRNGDKWYNALGTEIPDPTVLKASNDGTDPQPYLTNEGKIKIDSSAFNPNNSFTDYKPKVTASPRFQFNFPINDDKARFYAHYDILVQRPKEGNYATPLDYYFLEQNTGTIIGNPNLKPQKTFDYELGYSQNLTSNSAVGISAFYRERKDMIQVRPYLYASPRTYYTYGNRDFSTTKGFTLTYDYRKPQSSNIPLDISLAYTLQFADGTGSSSSSSNGGNGSQVSGSGLLQNFISSGLPNLRYVSPLSYDSRHNINLNLTYSYDEGEGPMVGGKHFLQNVNVNMILRARSGEPYTTYQNVVGNAIQGGLNGTRLPWHFGADIRFDKSFTVKGFSKKSKVPADGTTAVASTTGRTKYYMTAFIYFQNVFNIKEILGVYPYTSRPDDDGFIASSNGKQYFNSQTSPQTLQDLYSLYIINPNFYNAPRRATIGFSFSF